MATLSTHLSLDRAYSNFLMVRIIQLSFVTDHTGGGRGRAGREKGGGREGGGRIGGGGKG